MTVSLKQDIGTICGRTIPERIKIVIIIIYFIDLNSMYS